MFWRFNFIFGPFLFSPAFFAAVPGVLARGAKFLYDVYARILWFWQNAFTASAVTSVVSALSAFKTFSAVPV